ncbi:hypothetical protein KFE96_00040 [Kordiimonas sp. SCSIO 12603]|uniref:hypothetical protein n=1 Tax=Kordiimonas sp. SCSIO 12603 TaxID=2829596 RepID=UPI002106CF4E|nr:hypothetical protein [Kordiimonas sp. SCSIO 12603]UTW58732.1 hypothetical protein KFE96_00040 [Kordiimonas sp. SCSIO 12603]
MIQFIRHTPLLLLLLCFNVFVLLLFAVPAFWPMPEAGGIRGGDGVLSQSVVDLSLHPRDINLISKRPLFHENRLPPQEIRAAVPQVVETVPQRRELNFSLAGILGSASSKKAYLVNTQTQQTRVVQEGDQLNTWLIDKITDGSVILVSGDDRRVLRLSDGR